MRQEDRRVSTEWSLGERKDKYHRSVLRVSGFPEKVECPAWKRETIVVNSL